MVLNLLRCQRQEVGKQNWKPQYRVVGDMVEVTVVEVKVKSPTLEPAPYQRTMWPPYIADLTRCPSSASPRLAIDASFRHRNGRAQGASTIQSVQRTPPNEKGRTIDVHDLVSISRRCTPDVPLAVVCAFLATGSDAFSMVRRRSGDERWTTVHPRRSS